MNEKLTLTINEAQVGVRLDKHLVAIWPTFSRSRLETLIKDGHVRVNHLVVKPSYKTRLHDLIEYEEPPLEEAWQEGEDIAFTIVHEDEDIIIVDKPAGLVIHPAPGHKSGTLVNGLLARFPNLSGINGVARPGIVHRIDKDTSGLLVVAKHDQAHRFLAAQLLDHTMRRSYIALVKGVIAEDKGIIKAPIGRYERDRKKMAVVPVGGKAATTRFTVLKRFRQHTLVDVQLETGRTHQIRVHMAHIGHPIAGDGTYGGRDSLYTGGQLLHAYALTLIHPRTKEKVVFETALPKYFTAIINQLT